MTEQSHDHSGSETHARGHGGHGWLMMVCCIPMVVIAIALVAVGAVKPAFLVYAVLCVGMMALMMRAMGGTDHGSDRQE